jgi:hypothetical protein
VEVAKGLVGWVVRFRLDFLNLFPSLIDLLLLMRGRFVAIRPYIFSRYTVATESEILDAEGQKQLLLENQGTEFEHRTRGTGGDKYTLIMEPTVLDDQGFECISFRVGIRRVITEVEDYDKVKRKRKRRLVQDITNIQSAHFLAIPELNLMAVEDRSGEFNVRATVALNALKIIIRDSLNDNGSLDLQYVSDDDVRHALETWALTEYTYTARPLNPISHTTLAQARTDLYKQENVIRDSGKLRPPEGESLEMNGGIIQATQELAEVGYAQNGVRGTMPDGQIAQIPKPQFHEDRHKNIREREKPRYIRVFLDCDDEDADDPDFSEAATNALIGFYHERP